MNLLVVNLLLVVVEALLLLREGNRKSKKIFMLAVFMQTFVLHAFCDPFSVPDLPVYVESYHLYDENTLRYSLSVGFVGFKMEPGWVVFCKILSFFSSKYVILMITTSILIVYSYCSNIYKHSPYLFLSVFLWLCINYNQSLFVLRQHTAMALCLLSIGFIVRRELWKFIAIMAVAISFHYTASVFLLLYVVYGLKVNRKTVFWGIIALLVVFALRSAIFGILFSKGWYGTYEEGEGANYVGVIISCFVLFLFLFSRSGNLVNMGTYEKLFFLMTCMSVCLAIVGLGFSPTGRLNRYFQMSYVFLVPMSIKRFRGFSIRLLITCVVITFWGFLFYREIILDYYTNYRLLL